MIRACAAWCKHWSVSWTTPNRATVSFDDMARPLNLAAATLEGVAQGHPVEFSWRTLARGDPRPLDLHRFVEVRPVLDHSALEPGGKATAAIREIVSQLGLQAKYGAQTSLTGPGHHIRQPVRRRARRSDSQWRRHGCHRSGHLRDRAEIDRVWSRPSSSLWRPALR